MALKFLDDTAVGEVDRYEQLTLFFMSPNLVFHEFH